MFHISSVKWLPWVTSIVGLVLLVVVVAIVTMMWGFLRTPEIYRFSIPPHTALTEPIAIELSRTAMIKDGKDPTAMQLVTYRTVTEAGDKRDRYFAANLNNPSRGYVQWMTAQATYSVQLEKQEQYVLCQVYRTK